MDTTDKIKLTIKHPHYEIEVQGNTSDINNKIESISELIDKIEETIDFEQFDVRSLEQNMSTTTEITSTPVNTSTTQPPSTADVPTIKPTSKLPENIMSLFNTTWGKTPRAYTEVQKALEVNVVYSSKQAVSTTLRRLVQNGQLRRIERDGNWHYVAIPGRE